MAIAAALAVAVAPRSAGANGAFPDSLQILLPRDAPRRIIFSTNFGLVISNDDGVTWSWTCEQPNTTGGFLYQIGAPPDDNLYAVAAPGLAFSTDGSCTWELSKGRLDNAVATDAFTHPTDPSQVLAIAVELGPGDLPYGIYRSTDGGRTFGPPIYSAPAGGGLLGVEIARSDPRIITLAMFEPPGIRPRLVRSVDDGATWAPPLDLEPQLGPNWFSIVAVDPRDAMTIYFRVTEPEGETLGITRDGGVTITKPVMFADRMTGFVQLPSGTILVAGFSGGAPVGFRSIDGGKTFTVWDNVPGVRALGERAGKLFVLGDNFVDKFALAVSTDEGMTLEPVTTFSKISSINACAKSTCQMSCDSIADRFMIWSNDMCRTDGGVAGADTSDGGGAPPNDGSPKARTDAGGGAGCGCAAAGAGGEFSAAAALAALAALLVARRRRCATTAGGIPVVAQRATAEGRWLVWRRP